MKIKNKVYQSFGVLAVTALLSTTAWAADVPEDMALVPGGSFLMGVDKSVQVDTKKMTARQRLKYAVSREAFHDEGPAHMIILDPYYMDKHEVSNRHYGEFIKATGHPAPAYWDDHKRNKPDQPVSGVNWHDAKAYCSWANKRLPTEAEWEKAARGPEGFKYPWGNDFEATKANFGRKQEFTANVDSYPEGKSPYGLYNMAGNVFEWVQDWYAPDYYKFSQDVRNPQGPQYVISISKGGLKGAAKPAGKKKVIRGGSWFAPHQSVTTTHRFWNDPMNNSYGIGLGFRCAMNFEPDEQKRARSFYMKALIYIGAEKYQKANESIGMAIKSAPKNKEYQALKKLIEKELTR